MGVGDVHRLELEPEVADAREQAVQLRLVDDFAGELGGADTRHEHQAAERTSEPWPKPPAYRDPNPQGRCHGPEDPACLRETASCTGGFTQDDSCWRPSGATVRSGGRQPIAR